MAAHSPASSPRLPSPPPIAEDQLGPASPGVALFEDHGKVLGAATDPGASRRIRPGTKAEDMAEGPPLVELAEIDSAFQLTEHLKALHHHHTHPPNSHTTQPITADIARRLAHPPANTSKEIWLYELARFLIQKTNSIIVALFADSPPCSAQTCPEMRASEWQYLCAVHDPPKSCSAIDYCCHTLDWAAASLTSSKLFPSRLGLGSGASSTGIPDKVLSQQMKEITNVFRRVYRIYAHAWFQHREMFWRVEGKTGLYVFFKTVCDEYGLIQVDNYTIPPEAEGLEPPEDAKVERPVMAPTLLKRDNREIQDEAGNKVIAGGETTKRHRHSPKLSTSSVSSVNTVIKEEENEDEEEVEKPDLRRQTTKLKEFAESLPQPGQQKDTSTEAAPEEPAEEEPPVPGLPRSDTIKPPKESTDETPVEEDDDGINTTVVEVEPSPEEKAEPKVEVMEPTEAPAAEGEEAGKSVAD